MITTRYKQARAFTLIELMIVIAIIAILAGIMVPNFMRARAESQLSGCEQNLKNIATAAELYLVRHKIAEADSERSIACDVGAGIGQFGTPIAAGQPHESHDHCLDIEALVDSECLKAAPVCPATGEVTYVIDCGHNHNGFTVYCSGTNHSACDIPTDYPKYSSASGLIEK